MNTFASDTVLAQNLSSEDSSWELVFSDEFNQKDGSMPNAKFWSSSPRGWSTWDRWVSDSPQVVFIRDGHLVCRAIRNTNPLDTATMITGAVETKHKFSFRYGKIEVRARTKSHEGNFPAFWLLPQPPAESHPFGGEIDVFESFGNNILAFHTVHTNWTLNLKHTSPTNTFNRKVDIDRWHVYGLVWTERSLVFTVDGKVTGSYVKSSDPEALANKQWPFDKPFYIILNQSVRQFGTPYGGDPDIDYKYETQFDWVRVYKQK